MFMMLASVGLPGTSGFVGELLVLVGIWKTYPIVAIFCATGLILGAIYMLWLYRRVMFGKAVKEEIVSLEKLSKREIIIFVPIIILVRITSIIFYQTSWNIISKRLTESVVADINVIVKLYILLIISL